MTGIELWEAEPPLAGVPPMKAFSLITHGPHPLAVYQNGQEIDANALQMHGNEVLEGFADQMNPDLLDFLTK